MNLIQVQEQLKGLPNDPRVMQMLASYANGMNPAVPPYLALGELNRRKQMMEKAQQEQAGQPPQGNLKEQITQATGIMALQQGRQQQGLQQLAQGAAQAPGPVPAGIQSVAQAQPQAPVRMRSGGIVALSDGTKGTVDDEIRRQTDANDQIAQAEETGDPATIMLAQLSREASDLRAAKPTEPDTEAARKAAEAKYPELAAAANKDYATEALKRLDDLQALRRSEIDKQRTESERMKPTLFQLLGQAATRTRGQKGIAPILGEFTDVARKEQAKGVEEERGLRKQEIELQETRNAAMDKIDEMKRARAEGRISDYLKAQQEYQKLLKDYQVARSNLLGRQITAASSLAGRLGSADIAAQARRDTAGRGGRLSDVQALAQATTAYQLDPTPENKAKLDGLREAFRRSRPELAGVDAMAQDLIKQGIPPETAYATATANYRAASAGVTSQAASVKAAREAVRKDKLLNPEAWDAKVKRYGSEQAAEDAEIDAYLEKAAPRPFPAGQQRGTAANPIKLD